MDKSFFSNLEVINTRWCRSSTLASSFWDSLKSPRFPLETISFGTTTALKAPTIRGVREEFRFSSSLVLQPLLSNHRPSHLIWSLRFCRERLRTHSIESSGKLKFSPEQYCDFTAEDLRDLGEIGRGAYGSVNKMVHKPTGQIMAVKVSGVQPQT